MRRHAETFHQIKYIDGKLAHKKCASSLSIRKMQIKTCIKMYTIGESGQQQILTRVQREPGSLMLCGRSRKWCSNCRRQSTFSLKTKHALTIKPNNCAPGHLTQRNEDLCSHKNLHCV